MSRLEGILEDYTGSGDVDDVYQEVLGALTAVSYTHLRAHET